MKTTTEQGGRDEDDVLDGRDECGCESNQRIESVMVGLIKSWLFVE